MWMVKNQTAYAAEHNWTRDKLGRHQWIVSVRATFDVDVHGKVTLADEQEPPALAPEYLGAPGASSLRWDSDLLYIPPCTDVIAEACAHAPRGKGRTSVPVSLRVGRIYKQLLVYGPRTYYKGVSGIATTAPEPFVTQPIVYESAYGGVDTSQRDLKRQGIDERNPIGRGFALRDDSLVNAPAPTQEYPGADIKTAGPAGFGALDPAWMPRRALAGTYDEVWVKEKKPLLPSDYNPLYGSSAPSDQRALEHLRGNEPVELLGLTAEGVMRFTLPAIQLSFTTHIGHRTHAHHGKLARVLLLPERKQFALIWQTNLMVGVRDVDYVDRTDVVETSYAG